MRWMPHNLDRSLRRLWPVILATSLGCLAYLHASAASSLLEADWPIASSPRLPSMGSTTRAPEPTVAEKATIILRRNAFDAETGPLDPASLAQRDTGEPAQPAEPLAMTDPLGAPRCEFGWVVLIATAEDPAWSFAAIGQPNEDTILRRVGSTVGEHTVEYIARDRVWAAKGTTLCQMKLGDKPPQAKKRPPARSRSRRGRTRPGQMPPDIAKHIRQAGENHVVVDRVVIDEVINQRVSLFRGTRVRPKQDDGVTVGMTVSRVRSGSLLHALGLRSGDVVRSINGFSLTSPQQALEAYGRLRTADRLAIELERGGRGTTIDVDIR